MAPKLNFAPKTPEAFKLTDWIISLDPALIIAILCGVLIIGLLVMEPEGKETPVDITTKDGLNYCPEGERMYLLARGENTFIFECRED